MWAVPEPELKIESRQKRSSQASDVYEFAMRNAKEKPDNSLHYSLKHCIKKKGTLLGRCKTPTLSQRGATFKKNKTCREDQGMPLSYLTALHLKEVVLL